MFKRIIFYGLFLCLLILGYFSYNQFFNKTLEYNETSDATSSKIKFSIGVQETVSNSITELPYISLVVSDNEMHPSLGYTIEHQINIKNDKITVTLGKIIKPKGAAPAALGSAMFNERLNINEGAFILEFDNGSDKDKYKVTITSNVIKTEVIKNSFTSLATTQSNRVPLNLYIAECGYSGNWLDNPWDNYCQGFFEDLNKIAQQKFLPDAGKEVKVNAYTFNGNPEDLLKIRNEWLKNNYGPRIHRPYEEFTGIEYAKEKPVSISQCDISQPKNVYNSCLEEVAFYSKNIEICEKMTDSSNRAECYASVAKATLDIRLCEKSSSGIAESCYRYILARDNRPELCETLNGLKSGNSSKDICYFSYADFYNNKVYCEKIESNTLKSRCFSRSKP